MRNEEVEHRTPQAHQHAHQQAQQHAHAHKHAAVREFMHDLNTRMQTPRKMGEAVWFLAKSAMKELSDKRLNLIGSAQKSAMEDLIKKRLNLVVSV